MATRSYVCVAAHAISPSPDGTVAPGDPVDLDPETAAFYLQAGQLVEAAPVEAPATTPKPAAAAKAADTTTTGKETDQ